MAQRIYLDHNATAPMRPDVREVVMVAMALAGNPSSVHAEGREARSVVENARGQVGELVGARARDVIFVSGGTEAAATVLTPGLRRASDKRTAARLFVSATEHPCVLEGHRFPAQDVEVIPVDGLGVLRLDVLKERLAALPGDVRALVSVHAANNETGVIQPLGEIASLVHGVDGLLHSDAVQAVGKVPLDVGAAGLDVLTLTAHKFAGPKGAGAIVIDPDIVIDERLLKGGGQELGRRAGTTNVAGYVGLGAAATIAADALSNERTRLSALRDRLEADVRRIAPDVVIFGEGAPRLPNTSLFAVPGGRAETLLMALDLAGFAISSGSACSSGKVKPSHVLAAMGTDADISMCALRISLGWSTHENDVIQFVAALEQALTRIDSRRVRAA